MGPTKQSKSNDSRQNPRGLGTGAASGCRLRSRRQQDTSGSTPAVQLEVHDESRWGASTMFSHIDRLESVAPDVGAHESILKQVPNRAKTTHNTEEMQSSGQS